LVSQTALLFEEAAELSEAERTGTPKEFFDTRFAPEVYIKQRFGWDAWAGADDEFPGQQQVLDAYVLALRQQLERDDYEQGRVRGEDLRYWTPGQTIKNRIRVEAGHTVGKTKLAAGVVNHFFDHFIPGITYTFAPSWTQIHDLLWKEVVSDRRKSELPGQVFHTSCEIKHLANHFAKGKATNDAGGKGTERVHGQHEKFLLFVIDEAEGVADFVYDAIDSMASGGVVIVLLLANPRTRASKFHKLKTQSNVKSFRISCHHHPNVLEGREVVPGAVRRQYVLEMVEKHCEVGLPEHEVDNHTFDLPFPVFKHGKEWPAGTIIRPNAEYLFRVKGIAPANISDKCLITVGRYEAAVRREAQERLPRRAWMGVDVARWGADMGTLYVRRDMVCWRARQFSRQDTNEYARVIHEEAEKLAALGVAQLDIRVDGGGGFGGGVVDRLKADPRYAKLFSRCRVFEVHFGAQAEDLDSYDNLATEMYAECAETLLGVKLLDPPETLESDLTEREYGWVNKGGIDLKRLEKKEKFKERVGRSPDDGDGCVLCLAPDRLFANAEVAMPQGEERVSPWQIGGY
jgi:hypothetical protein